MTTTGHNGARRPKLFRDPIHNVISHDMRSPQGQLLVRLIDTSAFQRLRHIRQLGLAHLVYHGAEHSRFAHAMGTAHLAERFFDAIERDRHPADEQRVVTVAAALLHDIGHAPFSHAFENTLAQSLTLHHEAYTERIILWPEGDVYGILADFDPSLPQRVADLLTHRSHAWTAQIISSQLDADRMDYLLRDGYMTGVQNYHYDAERILEMLDRDDQGPLVHARSQQAVESYLLSRFHMYQQVYYHKTVRAAETLIESIFRRVFDTIRDGDRSLLPSGALGRFLSAACQGQQPEIADYLGVHDAHVWVAIDTWTHCADPILRDLCRRFATRNLLKTIEVAPHASGRISTLWPDLEAIVAESGFDPRYYLAFDRAENSAFIPYAPPASPLLPWDETNLHPTTPHHDIRILLPGGRVAPIQEVSDVVRALTDIRYRVARCCLPAEARQRATSLLRTHHLTEAL